MLDNTQQLVAGAVLLSMIGIAYGGTFLLRVTRGSVPANDLQQRFFRAGHAHAGVLVILGLLVLLLTRLNDVPGLWQTLASGVLIAAILMPAGFFLSVLGRDPQRPGKLIALLWAGAAALVVGLGSAGVGHIVDGTQ
jgi:ABC-type Na+ efflux pump permease subunit